MNRKVKSGTIIQELIIFCFLSMGFQVSVQAQAEANYDESKVPEFVVPDPLLAFDGMKINSIEEWEQQRRPELLEYFESNIYGKVPGVLHISSVKVLEESCEALDGKARRKQVEITFERGGRSLSYTMLIYLPKNESKAPVFLGYNFWGNHSIIGDEDVIISGAWARNKPEIGVDDNRLTEKSRAGRSTYWSIERIIEAGFGLATVYYGEIDPDRNERYDGIQPLLDADYSKEPRPDEWGSIAAWAWGLSRCMDYFEQDEDIDQDRVVAFGHSRLGKTALWAGASDQRFKGVISNNSGCGGAALSKRRFGETVATINTVFPHWFCQNFKKFNNKEGKLPVDQHQLISLLAPRPAYIASASDDQWADPRGEFLSGYYASPVYELYGLKGMDSDVMPEPDQPQINTLSYHIRSGRHNVTDFDWEQYIEWANIYIK